jgi:hypothetical protein
MQLRAACDADLEVDGCEVSLVESEAALGVVTSRFFYRVASMAKKKSGINPFYVLLVLLGIAFTVTACAYGVMAFKAVRRDQDVEAQSSGAAMLNYLDRHGAELMGLELALLAACTFAAMSTDRYWIRRETAESRRADEKDENRGSRPA